jgi:hypothetical protein
MILEGAMIILACISLTVLHPGVVFEKCWEKMRFSPRVHERPGESKIENVWGACLKAQLIRARKTAHSVFERNYRFGIKDGMAGLKHCLTKRFLEGEKMPKDNGNRAESLL